MKRKGEATVGSVVVGTLIFFAVFTIFAHMYGDLRSSYDFSIEGNTSAFYDSFQGYSDEVYGYAKNMSSTTEASEHETLSEALGYQLIVKGIWQSIILIFKFILNNYLKIKITEFNI